jgi:hypothetical protein
LGCRTSDCSPRPHNDMGVTTSLGASIRLAEIGGGERGERSLSNHVYINERTDAHIHACVYKSVRTNERTHARTHTHTHTSTRTCAGLNPFAHLNAHETRTHRRAYTGFFSKLARTNARPNTHTHTHTHTQTHTHKHTHIQFYSSISMLMLIQLRARTPHCNYRPHHSPDVQRQIPDTLIPDTLIRYTSS